MVVSFWSRHFAAAVTVACTVASGCDLDFVSGERLDVIECRDGVGSPLCGYPAPWPDYVTSLGLPACPAGAELIVDTASDEFDGGSTLAVRAQAGERLSFREALWLAHNGAAASHVIRFDPNVFPATAPTRIIMDGRAMPVVSNVCVDGRGSDVVLGWSASECSGCEFGFVDSTVYGMTLDLPPIDLEAAVVHFFRSTIAGCRLGTDGSVRTGRGGTFGFEVRSSDFGPGNVVGVNAQCALRTRDTRIHDSFFGTDPVTKRSFPQEVALWIDTSLYEPMVLTGNTVVARSILFSQTPGSVIELRDNELAGLGTGVGIDSRDASVIVGPGNSLHGFTTAVVMPTSASDPYVTTVTRNAFFDNQVDIESPVAPPAIATASVASATVTCAEPGLVEVFGNTGLSTQTFLDSVACDPATTATVSSFSSPLRVGDALTATLTRDSDSRTSSFATPVLLQ